MTTLEKKKFIAYVKQELNIDLKSEFLFAEPRKFCFDFCIPSLFIAIECDGGAFKKRTYRNKKGELITTIGGRHNSGTGFLKDMEKLNLAAMMGWRILRFTPVQLCTNVTIETIRKTIQRSCEFTTVNNNVKF
jgi:very-short-patch-repair endonuclease